MKLQVVYHKELISFIESEKYKTWENIPLSTHRAYSQYKNPRANENDPILVYAETEQGQLAGFWSFLPDYISGNSDKKIYWNTGWWVHPQHGKSIAMPLFLRALQLSDNRMMFSDLTPHTSLILSQTKKVEIPAPIVGIRLFFKFCFAQILLSRYPKLKPFQKVFHFFDNVLNLLSYPVFNSQLNYSKNYSFEIIQEFDSETKSFIELNQSHELTKRKPSDLLWIFQNPWIISKNEDKESNMSRFPFTSSSKHFEQVCYKVIYQSKICAVFILNNRDSNITIPYIYIKNGNENAVIEIIISLCKKAKTLTIYSDILKDNSILLSHKALFKKKTLRFFGYTKGIISCLPNHYVIQDGDGDCVFT